MRLVAVAHVLLVYCSTLTRALEEHLEQKFAQLDELLGKIKKDSPGQDKLVKQISDFAATVKEEAKEREARKEALASSTPAASEPPPRRATSSAPSYDADVEESGAQMEWRSAGSGSSLGFSMNPDFGSPEHPQQPGSPNALSGAEYFPHKVHICLLMAIPMFPGGPNSALAVAEGKADIARIQQDIFWRMTATCINMLTDSELQDNKVGKMPQRIIRAAQHPNSGTAAADLFKEHGPELPKIVRELLDKLYGEGNAPPSLSDPNSGAMGKALSFLALILFVVGMGLLAFKFKEMQDRKHTAKKKKKEDKKKN